jgi:hypothetical protein
MRRITKAVKGRGYGKPENGESNRLLDNYLIYRYLNDHLILSSISALSSWIPFDGKFGQFLNFKGRMPKFCDHFPQDQIHPMA